MATELWPVPERNGSRPLDAGELIAALHVRLGALRRAYRDLSRLLDAAAGDAAAMAASEEQFSALIDSIAEGYEMVGALRSAGEDPQHEAIADTCELALEMLWESVTALIALHSPGAR